MEYSYQDLLAKLYDLKSLATPPSLEEKGGKEGNWPRQCYYDETTGQYQNWGVKALMPGYTNYLYTDEDGNEIVMDMDGPGVIWRCWTCAIGLNDDASKNIPIKIWFDNEATPSVDTKISDFFSKHTDDLGTMNFPNLVSTEKSRGAVYWMPIPFQQHIKIAGPGFLAILCFQKTPSCRRLLTVTAAKIALRKHRQIELWNSGADTIVTDCRGLKERSPCSQVRQVFCMRNPVPAH